MTTNVPPLCRVIETHKRAEHPDFSKEIIMISACVHAKWSYFVRCRTNQFTLREFYSVDRIDIVGGID